MTDSEMIAGWCFIAIAMLFSVAGWVQIWQWVTG